MYMKSKIISTKRLISGGKNHPFLILMMILFFQSLSFSQVAINANGELPDPSAMLDVKATGLGLLAPRMTESERPSSPVVGLIIFQTDNDIGYYYYDGTLWQKVGRAANDYWLADGSDIYFNSGKVGIGTSSPGAKAHISGGIEVLRLESSSDPLISFYEGSTYKAWMQAFDDDFYITNRMTGRLRLRTSNIDRLVIDGSGNVVIGATTGATGYILSVKGRLACDEILIDDQAYWPDYVFQKEYDLLTIDEFRNSVETNKHLPGMPSADDISENGGFHVGDMQKKLLEKIEELSLYIIELNERVKTLEAEKREMENNPEK